MSLNIESLSPAAKIALLARIAHTLTVCARDTYEVGTDNVLDPQTLRAYNELLHRVTDSVVSHLSGSQGRSPESVVEMVRSFGIRYNRPGEMDWALQNALQDTVKVRKE
jgi:hypothetical protein